MYKTETHLTLLGLLFTFGNISKLRNLHAHLDTLCNHSIIKLKACLQKCKRSSSHKNFTLLGLLFAFGTISKFWNIHVHLHAKCNHSIIKSKACLQKCRRSSSHKGNIIIFDPFGPLVCIWNNFKIPKLSCESTRYMQPFYNKIKGKHFW